MTAGGSSIPEVQQLLRVLAAGRRVAEAGTAFGEGAAAMADTALHVVTVESDPDRATAAAERLRAFTNVELIVGRWEEHLPPRAPFDLVFHDAGNFKRAPEDLGGLVVDLLVPGGLLVLDDLSPGHQGADAIRDWTGTHPRLAAAEILTTPTTSALLIARLGVGEPVVPPPAPSF
jgi:predicted O-methyltransferase YrrM